MRDSDRLTRCATQIQEAYLEIEKIVDAEVADAAGSVPGKHFAKGSVYVGAFIKGVLAVHLTFTTGEKRKFFAEFTSPAIGAGVYVAKGEFSVSPDQLKGKANFGMTYTPLSVTIAFHGQGDVEGVGGAPGFGGVVKGTGEWSEWKP